VRAAGFDTAVFPAGWAAVSRQLCKSLEVTEFFKLSALGSVLLDHLLAL
jgi:hypothetical protein